MPALAEIIEALFAFAPPGLAAEGDNNGLQVGDPASEVSRVVAALDVTSGLIREARTRRAEAVVVHHPLIFHPLNSLSFDSHPARLVTQAVRANLGVVSMHTNLDFAPGGVNDRLAETVGLRDVRPLAPCGRGSLVKLTVFVPLESQDSVRRAMSNAGAGRIGKYSECAFGTEGIGTFRPLEGAQPAIGKTGQLEKASEARLEMLVEKHRFTEVLQAMLAAHPYEEVAYDVYSLENTFSGAGRGRLGELPGSVSLKALASRIGRLLKSGWVRTTGELDRKIRTVAVAAGSVREMVNTAKRAGADVLLAGEIPHHERLEALDEDLGVIEAGHGPSERPAVWVLEEWLKKAFGKRLKVISYDPEEGAN